MPLFPPIYPRNSLITLDKPLQFNIMNIMRTCNDFNNLGSVFIYPQATSCNPLIIADYYLAYVPLVSLREGKRERRTCT